MSYKKENLDFTEFGRLEKMLAEREIPYKVLDLYDGRQLAYPNAEQPRTLVVLHSDSYGHSVGLLEMSGCLGPYDGLFGSVAGFCDAKWCYERILADWEGRS